MEHEEHKRKASPNADTPDPKIQAIDEKEYEEVKGEAAKEEIPYKYRIPHQTRKITMLECFFKKKYSEVLTQKVINLIQLEPKIDGLRSSFRRVCDDDFNVEDFHSKVNDLHGCKYFINACAETCCEEKELYNDMAIFKIHGQAVVRRECLLKDGFLPRVLDEKDDSAFTRGLLSVLLAYWRNEFFRMKVMIQAEEVSKMIRAREKVVKIIPMENREHKGKANPNALDTNDIPDPKIQVIDEDKAEYEEGEGKGKGKEVEKPYNEDTYPYMYWYPHLGLNLTKLECFFKETYSEVLTQKVIAIPQLKATVDDVVSSFRRVRDDDFNLQDFDDKVNDLHFCSDFIGVCAETCYEASDLVYDMIVYINDIHAHVRRNVLLKDGFLKEVLNATEYFAITRGILCVILAYWGNEAFRFRVMMAERVLSKRIEALTHSKEHGKVDESNVS